MTGAGKQLHFQRGSLGEPLRRGRAVPKYSGNPVRTFRSCRWDCGFMFFSRLTPFLTLPIFHT
jgi:hypothetical protein